MKLNSPLLHLLNDITLLFAIDVMKSTLPGLGPGQYNNPPSGPCQPHKIIHKGSLALGGDMLPHLLAENYVERPIEIEWFGGVGPA